jgi:hypothetical protein
LLLSFLAATGARVCGTKRILLWLRQFSAAWGYCVACDQDGEPTRSARLAKWPPTSADLDSDAGNAMPDALATSAHQDPKCDCRAAGYRPSVNLDLFGIPHPTASRTDLISAAEAGLVACLD